MPKYTDEEIDALLLSGDVQENDDGSVTWAADNSFDKKPGTWLRRPPKAAPLITTDTGAELAKIRQEKRRLAIEEGVAIGVSMALEDVLGGKPITTDEAVTAVVARLAEQGMDPSRKDYVRVVQLVFDTLGLLGPKTKVEVDARKQTIVLDREELKVLQEHQNLLNND